MEVIGLTAANSGGLNYNLGVLFKEESGRGITHPFFASILNAFKAEAEARGYPNDLIIVLESTFTTDGENHMNGLEPSHTYENYRWVFTRDFHGGMWNHLDHGYG